MPTKRVSINLSLPNEDFKDLVLRTADFRGKCPSQEFVDLYRRLSRHKK